MLYYHASNGIMMHAKHALVLICVRVSVCIYKLGAMIESALQMLSFVPERGSSRPADRDYYSRGILSFYNTLRPAIVGFFLKVITELL